MRIAIIGAGAAGLMTAATLAEAAPAAEIFLIEKNDAIGKKVLITGGGRCNVTTGLRDVRTVLTKYPRGGKFLSSAMRRFPPEAVYDWFESHGVSLKIEPDQRVFPCSNDGRDIVAVFASIFKAGRVRQMLDASVIGVKRAARGFEIEIFGAAGPLVVDRLVLTTGGQAFRQTGSTGDGYAFAVALGHAITKLRPSLSAFTTRETWPAKVSGLSFADAKITARRTGMPAFSGPFLFTHKGVSGPAIFALSALVAFEPISAEEPLKISIDLFPAVSAERLTEDLLRLAAANPARLFLNALTTVVPKSLVEVAAQELMLPWGRKAGETGRKEIGRCVAWLKGVPLAVVARGGGEEFVTAGGVDLKDVNPSTMESKITPGLYFAGEILDIDAFTGGFNLQSAWATGRLAGESLAETIS